LALRKSAGAVYTRRNQLVGILALGEHDGVGAELAASSFTAFLFHLCCLLPRDLAVDLRRFPARAQLQGTVVTGYRWLILA
jgi:hypothetical protein